MHADPWRAPDLPIDDQEEYNAALAPLALAALKANPRAWAWYEEGGGGLTLACNACARSVDLYEVPPDMVAVPTSNDQPCECCGRFPDAR